MAPRLADHAALLVEDQRHRVRTDPAQGDGRLGQRVLHLGLGEPEQRLDQLPVGVAVDVQADLSIAGQPVELQVQQFRHLSLVGEGQVHDLHFLLEVRLFGEGGADEQHRCARRLDLPGQLP
ncbi:MAG: hypothetical protein ACRDI2_15710 [Chloroflexota bacterium]